MASRTSQLVDPHDDCNDDLPPPPGHPAAHSSPIASQPVLPHQIAQGKAIGTKPVAKVGQDIPTPRSNRSVDSGLPHDEITPRSDSISTSSSSATPPDQQIVTQQSKMMIQQQREMQQQHRKSTSLDEINLVQSQVAENHQWKSCSLQRKMDPPSSNIYGVIGEGNENGNGELVIRRKTSAKSLHGMDDEDPYGRCLNMKLTSFTENQRQMDENAQMTAKDPRLIDFNNKASSTAIPRQGSPIQQQYQSNPQQFNTLPAHPNLQVNSSSNVHPSQGQPQMGPMGHQHHNTLPARVNNTALTPAQQRMIGRHFKPFDHKRMNPMAGIEENPNDTQEDPYPPPPPAPAPQQQQLIVQKSTHLPHMPSELRHTNYSSHHNRQLVNPQVLEHQRDSANFSLTSSDSG